MNGATPAQLQHLNKVLFGLTPRQDIGTHHQIILEMAPTTRCQEEIATPTRCTPILNNFTETPNNNLW